MKKHFLSSLLLLTAASLPLEATTSSPTLDDLEYLISASEKSLEAQRSVRDLAKQYLVFQEELARDSENKRLAFQLVKTANKLKKQIDSERLDYAFDGAFLEELTFLAQMGAGNSLPPA